MNDSSSPASPASAGTDAIVVVKDASALQDAPCDLCAGALRIFDASTGESSPCSSCLAMSIRTTREIAIQTPEMVGRTVIGELAAEGAGSPASPLACLSKWVLEHLDAERELRVLHAGLFAGATSSRHDEALARACSAEVRLRRALGATDLGSPASLELDIERERMNPIEEVAKLPGVDLTSHPALCDALIAYGLRRRSQEDASVPPAERVGSRILGSIGRAWGRLRRGWEP